MTMPNPEFPEAIDWEELRAQLVKAIDIEGSLAAVERAADLRDRALKNFSSPARNDRPGGPPTTLGPEALQKFQAYLQEKLGWPEPSPSLDDLFERAYNEAPPALSKRDQFAATLGQTGYFDEVSWDRVTTRQDENLVRFYQPEGGLTLADYAAFAPQLLDEINRAELCEAVEANLLRQRGVRVCLASRAARELDLCRRNGIALDADRLKVEALLSEAEGFITGR